MMKKSFLVRLFFVLMLMAISIPKSFAQDSLSTSLTPNAEVQLSAGFTPNPYSHSLTSGGGIDVSSLGNGCVGYAIPNPDFNLYWSGSATELRIYVESQGDTTLIINDPQGNWICNDDSNGFNPGIVFPNPAEGLYNIWVASYAANTFHPSTLYIGYSANTVGPVDNGNTLNMGTIFDNSIMQQLPHINPEMLQQAIFLPEASGYSECTESSDQLGARQGSAHYKLAGASGDAVDGAEGLLSNGQLMSVDDLFGFGFRGLRLGDASVMIILIDDFSNQPDDGYLGASHGFVVHNLMERVWTQANITNPQQIEIIGIDIKRIYGSEETASSGQIATALIDVIHTYSDYSAYVINMSFSMVPCSADNNERINSGSRRLNVDEDALINAIRELQGEGNVIVPIASAGNYGGNRQGTEPLYPAHYPDVVSVSGSMPNGQLWNESNYGEVMMSAGWFEFDLDGEHSYQIGTSFSAPLVSLIVAHNLTYGNSCYLNRHYTQAAAGAISYTNMPIADWLTCR